METDLSPNFLAKQKAPPSWRLSHRYLFYAIFAALLIVIWHQQHSEKKLPLDNSALIKKNQTKEQFDFYWDFLGNLFDILENEAPNDVHINEISSEKNQINIQGQALNSTDLNHLIFIFNRKLPRSELHLTSLDEKENLNFSLSIQSQEDFSLLENNAFIEIKNGRLKQLLQSAQRSQLKINLIKPENSKIMIQLAGSYSEILQFLLGLKKDHFSPNYFDIKPNKNQLELEAKLDVLDL